MQKGEQLGEPIGESIGERKKNRETGILELLSEATLTRSENQRNKDSKGLINDSCKLMSEASFTKNYKL